MTTRFRYKRIHILLLTVVTDYTKYAVLRLSRSVNVPVCEIKSGQRENDF